MFDLKLLFRGQWKSKEKQLVEEWIKEDEFDEKRTVAANLISNMIHSLLADDITVEGGIRSKRLGGLLQHFEDLLATTKMGIARKFYRDHLNHMLRVMLLTNALGKNVRSLSLTRKEMRLVTLAGLVHDIAYPLSEAYHILNETSNAITKCYNALIFPRVSVSYDKSKVKRLFELMNKEKISSSTLEPSKENYSHGLIGAIELLDYIKPERIEEYTKLLQAVIFHDSSVEVPRKLRNDSLLLTLTLGDEIQDWGRPVGLEKEPALVDIRGFRIDSNTVAGKFEWRSLKKVSPLRQVYAKSANFRRLEWPSPLKVRLTFDLPDYQPFNVEEFGKTVKSMIDYCLKEKPNALQRLNESWKESEELFRSFYGDSLPKTNDLPHFFLSHKVFSNLDERLFLAENHNEILHTKGGFGKLLNITIDIKSGKVKCILRGTELETKGNLLHQRESFAGEIARNLTTAIILFHGLTCRVALEKPQGLIARYPFPSGGLIHKAIGRMGLQLEEAHLIRNVRGLRRCLSSQGLFCFRPDPLPNL